MLEANETIVTVVVVTVLLSVFAHGMTAVPAAGRYAARIEREGAMEREPVGEMPTR
jgi:NhaP-type Na+/H+ or K+/H+ antiporter